MAYLLYDAAILILLLFFFLRARKKGLILTLCGLAAISVALFGARAASEHFAPKVADLLQPHFSSLIEEYLETGLKEKMDDMLAAGTDSSNELAGILSKFGFYEDITQTIRSSVTDQAAQTVSDLAVTLARTISELIARVVIFAVSFVLILVLWFLLSRALDLAARLPVINGINRTLGGLFGLLEGMLLLFLIAWILRLFGGVIPEETVKQTTLLNFFCTTNPISLLTGI